MSDTAADAIAESAAGPRRLRTETGEAEAHPIPDQIAADRYRRQCAAASSTKGPFGRLRKATISFGRDA